MPRTSTATATGNPTLSLVICASRPLIRSYDDRGRTRAAACLRFLRRRRRGTGGTAGPGNPGVQPDILSVVPFHWGGTPDYGAPWHLPPAIPRPTFPPPPT